MGECIQFSFKSTKIFYFNRKACGMGVPPELFKKLAELIQNPEKVETINTSPGSYGQSILNIINERRTIVFINKS